MGVDWAKSAAKIIIQDDLRSGVLPATAQELSAKSAWDLVYSHLVEFHGVEYAQYRTNLNQMRKAYKKKFEDAEWVKEAIAHDLQFRKTADANGLPLFHLSRAAKKLRKDMERGLHNTMKPKQFWRTRPEYQAYSLKIFREHIYQQVRRFKFENYLEDKRLEKEKEREEHLKNRNVKMPKRRRRKAQSDATS